MLLSRRAEADLDAIFEYTAEQFGLRQAIRYRDGLIQTFHVLSANPRMGRLARAFGAGVRRHEHGRHVILYELLGEDILILAVVHERRSTRLKP